MITQYPHIMTFTPVASSTRDASGNWVPVPGTEKSISCRAEPSNGNGLVSGPDGLKIKYDWVVFIPLPVDVINLGTIVSVFYGDDLLAKQKVLRFSKGQLNARIWL